MCLEEKNQRYKDNYEEILSSVPVLIERAKEDGSAPVLGLTSNLDVVLFWDAEKYNEILKEYLATSPSSKVGEVMNTIEDFARITADYMLRGFGGNFDIGTQELCDWLRNTFKTETALGGTCAQGAAALGAIGIPVNVHISDYCKEVCEFMDYPGLTTIKDGNKVPIMEAASSENPVCHFILQYKKGDKIKIGDVEYEIPASNRMILFYDEMQKNPPFKKDFFDYWTDSDIAPSSLLFSGFDAIIDEEIAQNKIDELTDFLAKMREKTPDLKCYFEGAFYMNPDVKTLFISKLGPEVNFVGMNEEELSLQLGRLNKTADLTSIEGIVEALDVVFETFKLRGVVLHSSDYSLYYGEPMPEVRIEDGLAMGNMMAATRARTGHYGTLEEVKETLSLPLSRFGTKLASQAKNWKDKGAGRTLRVVPSRYMEQPKYTVGLGDTFVAGVHTCFIKR